MDTPRTAPPAEGRGAHRSRRALTPAPLTSTTAAAAAAAAVALLATAALADAPAPPKGLPGPTLPEGVGVNIHFTDPQPGEMERFAAAGFGLARMDLFWHQVETKEGVYDFSAYDRLTGHLAKAGARPLFILDYGNDLYQKGAPTTPEARAAFARFAAAAARHFAGRGVLFEIWNEPNLSQFWQPEPDPEAYAALAIGAAKAMRAADPRVTIIGPGSSGFPWEFFEAAFRKGLLEHLDAVSVHPYRPRAPETAAEDFARLRALIARHAPKGKEYLPILSSEWGYSTNNKSGIPEERQAAYLTRMWLSNLASGVNLSVFYDWRDDGDDPAENEHRFGTVRRDFAPKPSYLAAQKLLADLKGYTFRHRLAGKAPTEWRLLFQRGDTDDLAVVEWSSSEKLPVVSAPAVRRVTPGGPEHAALRRLAQVRFPAGPRVESEGLAPSLPVELRPFGEAAKVFVTPHVTDLGGVTQDPVPAALGAGASGRKNVTLPRRHGRWGERTVPLTITWGGAPLPAVEPVRVLRLDPLRLAVVPRGGELAVTLENPARAAFSGTLTGRAEGRARNAFTVPVAIAAGQERVTLRAPAPGTAGAFRLYLTDAKSKQIVLFTDPLLFAPFADFGSRFQAVEYVENEAQKPAPLPNVKLTGKDAPAPEGLEFAYRFGKGWRYTQLGTERPLPIPDAARAMLVWVESDGSGDALRARFKDATGQTFQVDLGNLSWKGWKLVTVPLDGENVGVHWGGANDGVLHRPLAWESVALIDSMDRDNEHGGVVRFAAPVYRMAR